ncbi:MAG: CDP-alcohol phosphatidyltransferase family protein, partial [Clostridia bacterium]|nr:CDP-alcohol phosphatidyltransferase family protein [Clostridia bacterium]
YIARRFDMVSNLGKALDPVADKVTQIVMIGCLTVRFPHTVYILIVLCVKELFVMISSLLAIHRTEEVLSADWHGKVATAALNITMILHLLFPNMSGFLSDLLIIVCVCSVLFSGVLYGVRNIHILCTEKEEAPHE